MNLLNLRKLLDDINSIPKKILIPSVSIVLILIIKWQFFLGFYINLFNSFRPETGNFWATFHEINFSDSIYHSRIQYENLRYLDEEKSLEYIDSISFILDSIQQIILDRTAFLNFYRSLNLNTQINEFDPYLFLFLYSNNDWKKFEIIKDNNLYSISFISRENKLLPDQIQLISLSDSLKVESQIFNRGLWVNIPKHFQNKNLWVEVSEEEFFKFCHDQYQKHQNVLFSDFEFLFDMLPDIKNIYIVKRKHNYSMIIQKTNNERTSYWEQKIHQKFNTKLDDFLKTRILD